MSIDPEQNPAQDAGESPAALLGRAQKGDTQAFNHIVRLHENYVYRMCLSMLRNPQDAEDAMQDTFLNAYRNLSRFRGEARLTTWLGRIAMNEALQKLRKRRNTSSIDEFLENDEGWMPLPVEESEPTPEEWYCTDEMRKHVEEAVDKLPVPYRAVFVWRDICGETTQEIAETLDLKVSTVKSRLLRARLAVRKSLTEKLRKAPPWRGNLVRAKALLRMLVDRFCRAVGWTG